MGTDLQKKIPVMDNMWLEKDGEIHLIGSMCEDCGEVFFPRKEIPICSNCQSNRIKEQELSSEGIIHSYTVVYQMPAGGYYKGAIPFIYAIIEMPEGVYVQGHLTGIEPEKVQERVTIGDRVKAVLDVLFEDNGDTVVTYKFSPVK